MDNPTVDSAFQALHTAQRQAQLLYMDLRDAGDQINATNAQNRADRIQNEIDNLLNTELDGWQQGADALVPQLAAAATDAQNAVTGIQNDVQNAQKIAGAMQALDKAINLAMKFIG